MAALLGRVAGDPVRPRTWAAMGVAVAGFAVMAGAPTRPDLAGTVFSLITVLTFAATIVVARHKADVSMAPATCLSQVLVLVAFAPFAHVGEMGGANLCYLALLGIVQMGLGLFFLSLGARLIPAAEVALITQLENVLGPLWVWLAGIERPPAATVVGGVIVICAVVFQVTEPAGTLMFARDPIPGISMLVGRGTPTGSRKVGSKPKRPATTASAVATPAMESRFDAPSSATRTRWPRSSVTISIA